MHVNLNYTINTLGEVPLKLNASNVASCDPCDLCSVFSKYEKKGYKTHCRHQMILSIVFEETDGIPFPNPHSISGRENIDHL